MTGIKIKICGLTTPAAVMAVKGADYAGFIFYPPSPRNVTPQKAGELAKNLSIPAVAVTVDASDALLEEIKSALNPAYFQLHGNESPARVHEVKEKFGLPVIKAIGIRSHEDISSALVYDNVADMLLFDAKPPKGLPGGNGVVFDWNILSGQHFALPWFLSGGLTPDNVDEALRITGATMVDVSSSLESSPGIKNPQRVLEFIKRVKRTS